jgi:hypothetical protein
MLYEFAVTCSNDSDGGWRVTRRGFFVAYFRTFDEAIAAAREWDLAESTA